MGQPPHLNLLEKGESLKVQMPSPTGPGSLEETMPNGTNTLAFPTETILEVTLQLPSLFFFFPFTFFSLDTQKSPR